MCLCGVVLAKHRDSSHRVQTGSRAHTTSYSMVPGALSLGVKRPGREADHSPLSTAEIKNS